MYILALGFVHITQFTWKGLAHPVNQKPVGGEKHPLKQAV